MSDPGFVVLGYNLQEAVLPFLLAFSGAYIAYYPGLGTTCCFLFLAMGFTPIGPFIFKPHVVKFTYFLTNTTQDTFSRILSSAAMEVASHVETVESWAKLAGNAFDSVLDKTVSKINISGKQITSFIRLIIADLSEQADETRDLIEFIANVVKQATQDSKIWTNMKDLLIEVIGLKALRQELVGNLTEVLFSVVGDINLKEWFMENTKGTVTDVLGDEGFLSDLVAVITTAAAGFRDALSVAGAAALLDPLSGQA